MTTIDNATSSPPLPPANSPLNKQNSGTSDVSNTTSSPTGGTTSTAGASTAAASSSSVTTTISTQLQAVQAASSSDAVFSTNKVNEIKQAISEGRFEVNSAKVADGLLDSVHDLLGSRQRGG